MKKCVQIRISGKVQGVFFRATTREQAEALRLVGFVRNEDNGDVYIEAEGDPEAVQKLVDWCKVGPAGSRVADVEINDTVTKGYDRFEILR